MFKNFWNESRWWGQPHQLITDTKHWTNQEVKISQTRAQCDMERGGCWCAWLVIEEVSSGENRSVWLILYGEGTVSLPLAPHAHAVHAINYVTLPFNRFILLPHTPQPQLQQRSNRVEHPSLFFSHHLPENAQVSSLTVERFGFFFVFFFTAASLQTFYDILRSNVHMCVSRTL